MSRELDLWKGDFGDEYTDRNEITDENLAQRVFLWSEIFKTSISYTKEEFRMLEVGSNIGINLAAILKTMHRPCKLCALEPNEKAKKRIPFNVPGVTLVNGEASDIMAISGEFDFVFTSGVLIHMDYEYLKKAMAEIYRVSNRFILCIEYFAAEPTSKTYRYVNDFIHLRDYGSLWLDNHPLRCINYGFFWKRVTGLDNLTWWLFEKVH